MMDEELVWEEVSSKHIVQDEWIDFRQSAFRLPDGRVLSPFYNYSRRDYAVIVASDTDGNYRKIGNEEQFGKAKAWRICKRKKSYLISE